MLQRKPRRPEETLNRTQPKTICRNWFRTCLSASSEVVTYLLALGANPNDKPNGGASALDRCFWHLGFGTLDPFPNKRRSRMSDVSKAFDCMRELAEHGALWRPEDRTALNSVRRALYECEPAVTFEVVKLFAKNKVCFEETLEQLLDAPRMKQHLSALDLRLTSTGRPKGKRTVSRD